jgi:pullulanase/glycogen debranching enzyme
MKSVVANLSLFDWENDALISRLFRDTVIYEMHVPALPAIHHPALPHPNAERIWA